MKMKATILMMMMMMMILKCTRRRTIMMIKDIRKGNILHDFLKALFLLKIDEGR